MGYKIFVSYKYGDDSVYPLPNPLNMFAFYSGRSTVRDYVDKLELYFDHTSHIYKGESNDDDLSYLSDAAIWERLKDRIFDSSVTIVMISPNMKEPYRSERSQWIPWEISYSLRETTRGDRTSHSNAVLAVILPDRNHQYNYYIEPLSYQRANGQWTSGEDPVFSIIRKNMDNKKNKYYIHYSSHKIYMPSTNDDSYIPSVTWDDFIRQPMKYIECAVSRKEIISDYTIYDKIDYDYRWSIYG